MQEHEAFKLLTLASARDGRPVTPEIARVWAADLEDIDYMEAVQAAQAHYRVSDRWLMPSHVIDGVKELRKPLRPLTMSETPTDCAPGAHRILPNGTCMFCAAVRP